MHLQAQKFYLLVLVQEHLNEIDFDYMEYANIQGKGFNNTG